MGFYEDRQKRVEIFEDTMNLCRENRILVESVKSSIKNQKVYDGNKIEFNKLFSDVSSENEVQIAVSMKRSFEAAEYYVKAGKKVCVLNFASSTSPGGGVTGGSGAQEECLCRCSTLYPALMAVKSEFHDRHIALLKSGKMNALYNDDIIYTPDVMVMKTDTVLPKKMIEDDWYKVDVITCAAPNLRERPSNRFNPNSGSSKPKISEKELKELHKIRLAKIMTVAAEHGADVLVLGAFGCGAFQNPPELVAEAEKKVIANYGKYFKVIEFAVFCPPHDKKNYEAFEKVFVKEK